MIGIVADDITGANDIGVMYSKCGYIVEILFAGGELDSAASSPDVLIIDTDSRFDLPEIAYQKVFQATEKLKSYGATQFYNKTCSVFRGNIGPQFDAMQDALGTNFSILIAAFPKNGRETKNSIHYVYGKKLADSAFRDDPIHPMHESDLRIIVSSQTRRPVEAIHLAEIRQPAIFREKLSRYREQGGYVILDAETEGDLALIAEMVENEPIIGGSSGLAEKLASRKRSAEGVLIIAGSLTPQTNAQIERFKAAGQPVFEYRPEIEQSVGLAEMIKLLQAGRDVLLHSPRRQENSDQTVSRQVGKQISAGLADCARRIMKQQVDKRLIVAGGDTSAAVCEALQIKRMQVLDEVEPGLAVCRAQEYELILKSGSFGSATFFTKAVDRLKTGRCK
ncbi:four-carbon acid sugar kinase family protein [Listeria costaricensis]|uniref:four-carbon acid sugar kinase family protein n=1 Tax=Listeria costaricensis TaxID=2026604 RepID=UPI0013C4CEA0|nr:four-carbon acid sugar kinase family protein [Listeria costaricensis]